MRECILASIRRDKNDVFLDDLGHRVTDNGHAPDRPSEWRRLSDHFARAEVRSHSEWARQNLGRSSTEEELAEGAQRCQPSLMP